MDGDGDFSSFSVVQTAPVEYPTLRRHRIGIGLYDLVPNATGSSAWFVVPRVEVDVDGETTEVTELVGIRQPDLSCSTTATSPTPRSASTSGRWRP